MDWIPTRCSASLQVICIPGLNEAAGKVRVGVVRASFSGPFAESFRRDLLNDAVTEL